MITNVENFPFDDHDDNDEKEEEDVHLVVVLSVLLSHRKLSRSRVYVRNRLEWHVHVNNLRQQSPDAFEKMYRMSLISFNKLCSLIKPIAWVDPNGGRIRKGTNKRIDTEIILHCLLRWLSGGSHLDIHLAVGISRPAFYACCFKGIETILACNALAIKFLQTPEEVDKAASQFQAISTGGVVDGCVACADGLLIPIQTPSVNETGHVLSYYSGHYAEFGINVQAACDSFCRFVFVALAAPGRTSDVVALRKTPLCGLIESLPLGRYVIGDNAYVCTEHLLTPFAGEQRRNPQNDTYNYHLSQLRIRIEMTFGRFMLRWRLFRQPLQVKLKNVGKVFLTAARLHNFVENERLQQPVVVSIQDDEGQEIFLPSDESEQVDGNSMMRDILVAQVYNSGQAQPTANQRRNGHN